MKGMNLRIVTSVLIAALVVLVVGCGQGTKPVPLAGGTTAKPVEPVTSGIVRDVGDEDFASVVLKSEKPVLVDFWATWCGPCKTQGPIIERVGEKYADKITTVKLDVDKAPKTANEYQIRAIPTLMIFKGGKVVFNRTGLTDEAQLVAEITKLF
jgi:thioredoxin 1